MKQIRSVLTILFTSRGQQSFSALWSIKCPWTPTNFRVSLVAWHYNSGEKRLKPNFHNFREKSTDRRPKFSTAVDIVEHKEKIHVWTFWMPLTIRIKWFQGQHGWTIHPPDNLNGKSTCTDAKSLWYFHAHDHTLEWDAEMSTEFDSCKHNVFLWMKDTNQKLAIMSNTFLYIAEKLSFGDESFHCLYQHHRALIGEQRDVAHGAHPARVHSWLKQSSLWSPLSLSGRKDLWWW